MRKLGRSVLFSAAIAAALAFGAGAALADTAATGECSDPYPTCGSQVKCQNYCASLGYNPANAVCTPTGCCICDAV